MSIVTNGFETKQAINFLCEKKSLYSLIKNNSTMNCFKAFFLSIKASLGFGDEKYINFYKKINFTKSFDKALAKTVTAVAKRNEVCGSRENFNEKIQRRVTDASGSQQNEETKLVNQEFRTEENLHKSVEKLVKLITANKTAFTLNHSVEDYKAELKTRIGISPEAAEVVDMAFITSSIEEKAALIENFTDVDATKIQNLLTQLSNMTVKHNGKFIVGATETGLESLRSTDEVTNYYTNQVVEKLGGRDEFSSKTQELTEKITDLETQQTQLENTRITGVCVDESEVDRLVTEAREADATAKALLTARITAISAAATDDKPTIPSVQALIDAAHAKEQEEVKKIQGGILAANEAIETLRQKNGLLENTIRLFDLSKNKSDDIAFTITNSIIRQTTNNKYIAAAETKVSEYEAKIIEIRTNSNSDIAYLNAKLEVLKDELVTAQADFNIPFNDFETKGLITTDQEKLIQESNAKFNAGIDNQKDSLEAQKAELTKNADKLNAFAGITAPATRTILIPVEKKGLVGIDLLNEAISDLSTAIAQSRIAKAKTKIHAELKTNRIESLEETIVQFEGETQAATKKDTLLQGALNGARHELVEARKKEAERLKQVQVTPTSSLFGRIYSWMWG